MPTEPSPAAPRRPTPGARRRSGAPGVSIGADPGVVLALTGLNGAAFSARTNALAVDKGKGGTHGYFPDTRNIQTGFVAEGMALKKATRIQEMNLKDISAIVVKYLDLTMPTSEGKLPKNLFK